MKKLSSVQIRVLKWLGKGWRSEPGPGATVYVNGAKLCNTDTMLALKRHGLVIEDDVDVRGCWCATPEGMALTSELGL
jgi:hypothetical protein